MNVNGYEIKAGANLCVASLYGANLYGADLTRANLYGANLCGANLCGADLTRANLYGANLQEANLQEANLQGANLYGANLQEANLQEANLQGAKLQEANLQGANLQEANLQGAKLSAFQLPPEEGAFIGWKKGSDGTIIKLRILGKRTSSLVGRKCRCSKARVISIVDKHGTPLTEARSTWSAAFRYRVGELVSPVEPYNDDIRVECASGIHFFMTKKEAEEYY